MDKSDTPGWLREIQNKSWEPEILISGITLTFLFIITNHIYNFYGMLVQDFAVWSAIARNLNIVSLIILNGLKIILIIHLTLRGVWTGFVGLSYVFPDGVNKQNMPESKQNIDYDKPETFVIKIEKICSLLFSFIFSSITFSLGMLLLFIPMVMLFIVGLELSYIRLAFIFVIWPAVTILGILLMLLEKRQKKSIMRQKMENFIFNNVLATYFTNIGKIKTSLIFIIYFLVVTSISLPDISKFDFKNEKSTGIPSKTELVHINKDHYETMRDQKFRIPKAVIEQFRVIGTGVELFIAFYKEDLYTIKKFRENPTLLNKFEIEAAGTNMSLPDLYTIVVDDKPVSGLNWYSTDHIHTDQQGIITTIPLDNFKSGYHELKINKMFWKINKKKMKRIENWDIIPFEIDLPQL